MYRNDADEAGRRREIARDGGNCWWNILLEIWDLGEGAAVRFKDLIANANFMSFD